jgi:hypothetical protein
MKKPTIMEELKKRELEFKGSSDELSACMLDAVKSEEDDADEERPEAAMREEEKLARGVAKQEAMEEFFWMLMMMMMAAKFAIICDHWRPLAIICDRLRPCAAICGHWTVEPDAKHYLEIGRVVHSRTYRVVLLLLTVGNVHGHDASSFAMLSNFDVSFRRVAVRCPAGVMLRFTTRCTTLHRPQARASHTNWHQWLDGETDLWEALHDVSIADEI